MEKSIWWAGTQRPKTLTYLVTFMKQLLKGILCIEYIFRRVLRFNSLSKLPQNSQEKSNFNQLFILFLQIFSFDFRYTLTFTTDAGN